MRMWHKDLIHVLPQAQLVAQWRECCCAARNIAVLGHPNHILINRIMDYPMEHFIAYTQLVANEMRERGMNPRWQRFMKWFSADHQWNYLNLRQEDIFKGWHNNRYLMQCYRNLQEKSDCGGIEWREFSPVISLMAEKDLIAYDRSIDE